MSVRPLRLFSMGCKSSKRNWYRLLGLVSPMCGAGIYFFYVFLSRIVCLFEFSFNPFFQDIILRKIVFLLFHVSGSLVHSPRSPSKVDIHNNPLYRPLKCKKYFFLHFAYVFLFIPSVLKMCFFASIFHCYPKKLTVRCALEIKNKP